MNDDINVKQLKHKNLNHILIGIMNSTKFADELLEEKGHSDVNIERHAEFMDFLGELRNLILDFKDKTTGA